MATQWTFDSAAVEAGAKALAWEVESYWSDEPPSWEQMAEPAKQRARKWAHIVLAAAMDSQFK